MRLRQVAKAVVKRPDWAVAAAAPFAAAAVLVFFAGDPQSPVGAATSALGLLGGAAYLNRHRALDRARTAAVSPSRSTAGSARAIWIPKRKRRALETWEARLNHGWSVTASRVLRNMAESKIELRETRVQALAALCAHHVAQGRTRRPGRSLEVDIAIVSTLNLRGGTTSANEAEIRAYLSAGLTVALVHHPVMDRAMARPVEPRLRALIDDERVFEVRPEDTVRCDLAIVRFPVALEHLMDDRPRIDAAKTVLLVNQTPFEEYGVNGGYGTAWSIRDVHRNVTAWLGPHTWYAIGPVVRDVLHEHHADELEGIDLAADFWFETIDVGAWTPTRRRVRRKRDPIRIGRHSRDHVAKFPNMARRLRAAYPVAKDIEVDMLGARDSILRLLGAIPPGWTCRRFGAMSAVDFLAEVDVYVYFIDEHLAEAFGRAPLEAMAAGVPCILPRSFAELFGDGAVYCEPEEVESQVRLLMADPALYARRAAAGLRLIQERFSPEALLRRVGELGVAVDRPEPAGTAAALGGAR